MLFVHDHKFKIFEDKIYTTGSLTNELFKRYEKIFGKITILANKEYVYSNEKLNNQVSDKRFFLYKKKNILGYHKLKDIISLIKKEDYIILRMPSINSSIVGILCFILNKAYLVELVGCPHDALTNHGTIGKMVEPILTNLTKFLVKRATYVLYVTDTFLQTRYPTNGINIGCSDVIVDEVIETEQLRPIKKKDDALIIGTAGVVDVSYKGQKYVIEAIAEVKNKYSINIQYYLAGPGNEEYLKNIAIKNNVVDNVKFFGLLNKDEIKDFYRNLDIYIQPSLTEGMPRAVIEAMSNGCYCIGSNVGGIPELVGENNCFEKGNVNDIIVHIIKYYSNNEFDNRIETLKRSRNFTQKNLSEKRNQFYNNYKKMIVQKQK